ncbi:MAG: hypothetical protein HRU09_09185 [Oligoflexales bacterium]|nr:hypothetical protein [Oligoflexales bacterium]
MKAEEQVPMIQELGKNEREVEIYRSYLSFAISTIFYLNGPETDDFEDDVWSEIHSIGRKIKRLGGTVALFNAYNALSNDEKSIVSTAWKGIGGFDVGRKLNQKHTVSFLM